MLETKGEDHEVLVGQPQPSDQQIQNSVQRQQVQPYGEPLPGQPIMVPAYPNPDDNSLLPQQNYTKMRIDYAQHTSPGQEEKITRINLCQTFCNYFVILLTVIIMALGVVIFKQDEFQNLTIYTQAIEDWTNRSWQGFTVHQTCPSGTETIDMNQWLGTVEGNYTDSGVQKTDLDYRGQIAPNPPVLQYEIFKSPVRQICGTRTEYSYLNATRTNKISYSSQGEAVDFICEDGLIPCSTNMNLGGSTVCVPSTSQCPITMMWISSYDSEFAKYGTDLINGSDSFVLYQIGHTSSYSNANAPLQSLKWLNGQPCSYTDEQNVPLQGHKQPEYYPLEAVTNQDECHETPLGVAVDDRYVNQLSSTLPHSIAVPNVYDLEWASGVFQTLISMPNYYDYVPNPSKTKQELLLQFWTRTTIEFEVDCDAGTIQNAIDVLQDMKDNNSDTYEVNLVLFCVAAVSVFVQIIYMIVNTCCLCNSRKRSTVCFQVNNVIYHCIVLVLTGTVLGFTIANFVQCYPKYEALQRWENYNSCVDSYMQITADEKSTIQLCLNCVISQLSLAIMAIALHVVSTVVSLVLICCCKPLN